MPKTIALLTNNYQYFTVKRLTQEIKKRNLKTNIISPSNLAISIGNPELFSHDTKILINRCTATSFDDLDLLISKIAEKQKILCSNPIALLETFRDKDKQCLHLFANGINCIESVAIRGQMTNLTSHLDHKIFSHEKFIIKTIRGNKGLGVIFVNGIESLKSIIDTQWAQQDQRYIVQPFIDFKKEFRVIAIGNEMKLTLEKTGESFKKNATSSNFIASPYPPKEIIHFTNNFLSKIPSHFVALDIGIDQTGEVFLIEANLNPGIQAAENISGENIIGHYINWIIKRP